MAVGKIEITIMKCTIDSPDTALVAPGALP